MTTNGNLPDREPGTRLGDRPQLPARRGGDLPFRSPERVTPEPTDAQEYPGREAPATIKNATFGVAVGVEPTTIGLAPDAQAPEALPNLNIPSSFDELLYHAVLVNTGREVPTIVEQSIAAGASGSTTVSIPANLVDVARRFREGGDGAVTYRIEVDGVGRTAIPDHRVTGADRDFARYYEKYSSIIITFTNNDLVNASLLQIEWTSVQIDTTKWLKYRDTLIGWSLLLGIEQ